MPVTFTVANHAARRWDAPNASTAEDLFQGSCPKDFNRSQRIIQSSFSQQLRDNHISHSTHGFVRAVYNAYSHHHHLTLRPEDVWFSILSQLTFFVNAHAEELRSFFVSHEGRKYLEVVGGGSMDTVNFGDLAVRMTGLIEKNVVDPELRTWIMPAFSTTTDSDRVVAAVLMMGAMQKYFSYGMMLVCGIPSVTLLGEKEDWVQMVGKLDKITQLGEEPTTFARLLRPVLERFVMSFDNPSSHEVVDFWSRCAHKESGGSGPSYLTGWITAFCFWDANGQPLYNGPLNPAGSHVFKDFNAGCELDAIRFHRVDTEEIPCGFASVPVKVIDNGGVHHTKMVAGMVGIQATSSGQMLDGTTEHDNPHQISSHSNFELFTHNRVPAMPSEEAGLDSIQPVSGWWMYETESPEVAEAREAEKKAIDDELSSLRHCNSAKRDRIKELSIRSEKLRAF